MGRQCGRDRDDEPDRPESAPIATLAERLTAIAPRCHRADPRHAGSIHAPWWLAYCRPNQEMGISDRLLAADVPHLLPLARYDRSTPSGKRRTTDKPLFAGYMFLTGEGLASATPRALRGIVSASPVADVMGLVSDLSRLVELIEAGAPIGGEPIPYQPGERVRIGSGIYEGYEGLYLREQGDELIWLQVDMMNQLIPMAVEPWRIERIAG
jgi:transcription antitermination factor NusG